MSNAKNFFSTEDDQKVVEAIKAAEKNTSGEIRVHLENHCEGPVLERAAAVFKGLALAETEARNGVLFYLAVKDHCFAILGDKGIDEAVPEGFWDEIKGEMEAEFKAGHFVDGLTHGILKAGDHLSKHFPYQSDDKNELPDELSYGD